VPNSEQDTFGTKNWQIDTTNLTTQQSNLPPTIAYTPAHFAAKKTLATIWYLIAPTRLFEASPS
jgi:hypothetical protein